MKKILNDDESMMITWGGSFKTVGDQGIVEGKAIVFGSENQTDRSQFRDFFDETTYVHPEKEFTAPLFFEHAMEFRKPIGKARITKSAESWNAIAELDMSLPIVKEKFADIKAGKYGFSSGSAGHVVDRVKKSNGANHITQWVFSELSIVKEPAETRAVIHNVKSLDEFYGLSDESTSNDINMEQENLMKIIEMLITESTKKHVEDFLSPQLEEIKTQLAELKSASLPIGTDEDVTQQLTVLKSENEELKSSHEELQSSFIEKEALLSEKMVLLSEIQEKLDKSDENLDDPLLLLEAMKTKWKADFEALEEELTNVKDENEKVKNSLRLATEANRLLTKPNFKI